MNVNLNIKDLFIAGAHFGHKTQRWHPKMQPYIHSVRDGIHIINLEKTVEMLGPALEAAKEIAANNRQILFVGTKNQAHEAVVRIATELEMPYVVDRWMGGTLTNFETINHRIKYLKDQEQKVASGEYEQRFNKLELQRIDEEIVSLNAQYGGIKELAGLPGALIIVDAHKDILAVKEANRLKIPIIATCDTNVDPTTLTYPIPANDDAIKSIELILSYLAVAIKEGQARRIETPAEAQPTTPQMFRKAVKTTDQQALKPETEEIVAKVEAQEDTPKPIKIAAQKKVPVKQPLKVKKGA